MSRQTKSRTMALSMSLAVLLPLAVQASPPCTNEPKSAWLSETVMKERISKLGYREIKIFKTSGSCYEIYAIDAQGHKAEVYFNPVDGSVVESNVD